MAGLNIASEEDVDKVLDSSVPGFTSLTELVCDVLCGTRTSLLALLLE